MNIESSARHGASFRLTLQTIADYLQDRKWTARVCRTGDLPSFTKCLLYHGQRPLHTDTLYIVPEGSEADFPAHTFSYITTTALQGDAPHIHSVRCSFPELMNGIMEVFSQYSDFERDVCNLISSGGTLSELCSVAGRHFQNPVYIHDNMFCVIGHSSGLDNRFEFSEKSKKPHIPLWLINEFKFDPAYRDTFSTHHASIWKNDFNDSTIRSLYVNLWEGNMYLGRLLIDETDNPLRPGQYRIAECLAEYVLLWLRKQAQSNQQIQRSYEQIFIDLLTNPDTDSQDLKTVLGILNWKLEDRYLCLKLQSQDTSDMVCPDLAIHSRLSAILGEHISFRYQQRLCVILNLSVSELTSGELRPRLAPLVRDSCLYVGISNPIEGIHHLRHGFIQADIALDYITGTDSSDWMVLFSTCALNYIRKSACNKLPAKMVAHPVLLMLRHHDRTQGTQYYETLRAYLLCERNIPATAAALIIHRTTLTYRLGKIAEFTHLNLDNANLRLYLLLSFQLLEQEDSPEHHPD